MGAIALPTAAELAVKVLEAVGGAGGIGPGERDGAFGEPGDFLGESDAGLGSFEEFEEPGALAPPAPPVAAEKAAATAVPAGAIPGPILEAPAPAVELEADEDFAVPPPPPGVVAPPPPPVPAGLEIDEDEFAPPPPPGVVSAAAPPPPPAPAGFEDEDEFAPPPPPGVVSAAPGGPAPPPPPPPAPEDLDDFAPPPPPGAVVSDEGPSAAGGAAQAEEEVAPGGEGEFAGWELDFTEDEK
jgi:hypothetical protein